MDEGINVYSNPLYISLLKAPMTAPNIFSSEGLELDSHEDQDFFGMSNPAHIISDLKNEAKFNRLLGNLYLEFDFTKNLRGRISMGIDFNRQNEKRFYPDYGVVSASNAKRYSASKINSRFMQQVDALINYQKYFNHIHKLDVVVGSGFQNSQLDYTYGKSINSAADYFTTLSTGKADSVASNNLISKLLSIYSRGSYAYKDKYLANINMRIDGSSRFGSNNAYGVFYGLSGAWRISQEDFIKDNSKINELKLKLGYGISGNENIEDYAAYNLYGGAAYNLRGATKPISLGNKDLKWEQTGQFDVGLQFLGFKTRLGIDLDLYLKQTKDLYYIKELPSITGYSGILSNLGKMNNKGADISVFARITDSKLRWDIRVNLGVYKNKIIELNKDYTENYYGTYGLAREGETVGLIYGYKMLGIYDTNAEAQSLTNGLGYAPFEAGDVQFEDKNGDGTIDNNDLQVIGNPHPDFFGGFINSFNIGNWFLDINLTYSVGNDAFNTTRMGIEGMYNHFNQSTAVLKAWRKQGDANITNIPRIALDDPAGNSRGSSRWVEDASYLKIQSVGLSYVLPQVALKKLHLQNAQIYLKGMNLYTFSNYLGYTPDFISGSNPLVYGIDQGAYPLARTVILGVKIGL